MEELIIRRSELDDAHTLNEIISAEETNNLELLYNFPKVLNLIETSCLSVTVLDKNENILGCLVFDSIHEIITGMNDFMHENLWEDWLYNVFNIENDASHTPYNSLWLKYIFIAKGVQHMDIETEVNIVRKVFKFVYNTLPELEFIMYHLRKEASSSRASLEYIRPILEAVFYQLEKKDLTSDIGENLNLTSQIYVSDRSIIIQTLEIRGALEQDQDDLAEICNAQSELYTQMYGDYFIAELIANQTNDRKAIVAQVGKKAKGLMSLSTDIDYCFLAKNYELETYDNLCSFDFMDAIRYKRQEQQIEDLIKRELARKEFAREMHDNKLVCSDTANRMMMQQYCIIKQNEIKKAMEDNLAADERKKIQNRKGLEEKINEWLADFMITQPGEFFEKNRIKDVDLYGHIINPREMFLDTLTYFGLPKGYIEGNGQWKDYLKNKKERDKAAHKKQSMVKSTAGRTNPGRRKKDDAAETVPPYIDIQPLLDAFKNFVDNGAETRSKIRLQISEEEKKIIQLFCEDNGEPNEAKRQDILGIVQHLNIDLQPNQTEGFGWVLECFGGCKFVSEIIEVPEKPKEENSELMALRSKTKKTTKDQDKMVKKEIKNANYMEFKTALKRLEEYDDTLMRLGKLNSDILKRLVNEKESERTKTLNKWMQKERSQLGSIENPYLQLIEGKTEEEVMKSVPTEARNAVAINIFFIDKDFESRSIDFLQYAFQIFPDIEYVILTQPFRVEESTLLQSFIPVVKKENTNISHTLYIYNRSCLLSHNLTVRKSLKEDYEQGRYLLDGASNESEFKRDLMDAITNNASNKIAFSAYNQHAVVGFFVMTKDVNLEYYKSHFCIQFYLLLEQYVLTDHSRLLHSVVNPLFQRTRRFLFREILRLANKKTLLFEVGLGNARPQESM